MSRYPGLFRANEGEYCSEKCQESLFTSPQKNLPPRCDTQNWSDSWWERRITRPPTHQPSHRGDKGSGRERYMATSLDRRLLLLCGQPGPRRERKEEELYRLASANRTPNAHRRDETRRVVQALYQFHETIKDIKGQNAREWVYPRGQCKASWHWHLGNPLPPSIPP